jgi:hypothetical protein
MAAGYLDCYIFDMHTDIFITYSTRVAKIDLIRETNDVSSNRMLLNIISASSNSLSLKALENQSQEEENAKLKKQIKDLEKVLEYGLEAKSISENLLFEKFILVLNGKKDEIRTLRGIIASGGAASQSTAGLTTKEDAEDSDGGDARVVSESFDTFYDTNSSSASSSSASSSSASSSKQASATSKLTKKKKREMEEQQAEGEKHTQTSLINYSSFRSIKFLFVPIYANVELVASDCFFYNTHAPFQF